MSLRIICLGDSLCTGYGLRSGKSWVAQLDTESIHTWIHRGIPGDTTGGMLARLHRDGLDEAPDSMLLLGGYNDILLGAQESTKANIMALTHQCIAVGVRPVIAVPTPVAPDAVSPWETLTGPLPFYEFGAYRRWLRSFAAAFRLELLDLEQLLGPEDRRNFLPDGLHLSEKGHSVLAQAILTKTN